VCNELHVIHFQHEIQFAQRMEQLPPYLFGMINKMKTEKRLKGDDVIDLGMGNPVDPTPAPIFQKLCEVAQFSGNTRSPGGGRGVRLLF